MALLKAALILSDAVTAFVLFLAVVVVRFNVLEPKATWDLGPITPIQMAIAYALLWVGALWFLGLYRLRTHWTLRGELLDVLRATVLAIAVSLSALWILKLVDVSRLFLLLLWVAQPAVTLAARACLRVALVRMRSGGRMRRFMLVVGAGPEAEEFANEVEQQRELGLRVIGHLSGPRDTPGVTKRPVLGTIDEVERILHANVVDEVAVCLSPQDWQLVEPVTRVCEEEGRIVRVSLPALGTMLSSGTYEEVGRLSVVTFLYGPERFVGMAAKRAFDVAVSGSALIVLSPVLLAVAAYIRLTDGRPILFRHARVGLHGRTFTCLKFRTMVPDAEQQQDEHPSDIRGPAFKMWQDPRVTPSGRRLRRWSLDELPQLVNVLRGEMSIVGPRPAPPREVSGYSVWHRRRLSMKPGMTGLWQVQARHDDDFDRRADLDLVYIDRWSFWLDIKIMVRTIPAVVTQSGR